MPLIDSHCHLNSDYSPKTLDQVIQEAHANDVTELITIATDLESFEAVEKISERYPQVYHTIGIHPHDAQTLEASHIEKMQNAAMHPKCKAIGEIGLDYHYENSPKDIQKTWLEAQLDLAIQVQKPVVIHSREAEPELLEALKRYSQKLSPGQIPGVIHCFSGTIEFGRQCLSLGFYISFSGILTFKKADEIRAAAAEFPLEKILVETDAPFLAPVPHRGKKCEPQMVILTAQKLAELKGLPFSRIAEVTTQNARRVFAL